MAEAAAILWWLGDLYCCKKNDAEALRVRRTAAYIMAGNAHLTSPPDWRNLKEWSLDLAVGLTQ